MSDIALAITGGLAAITVLLFFLTRFDDDEPAGTTAALRVRPASLDLEVRF